MNLYKRLSENPSLRVESKRYGVSEIDGIELLNTRKNYPISVTFESGDTLTFSKEGNYGISVIDENYDIKIIENGNKNK